VKQTVTNTLVFRTLAVALLAGIGIHRAVAVHRPAGVAEYHARVREAAKDVPRHISGWVGQDVEVPARAVAVLSPNVMLSRRYVNVENGSTAGVMLVHCSDAHDMVGHFPLRCYPANGWDLKSSAPRVLMIDDRAVPATEYEFVLPEQGISGGGEQHIFVVNCLFRPGGKVFADMDGMSASIAGAWGQSSGAGQLQVYFYGDVPRVQRDAAVDELVKGYEPVLKAILAEAGH
jgi:hypothetical protein